MNKKTTIIIISILAFFGMIIILNNNYIERMGDKKVVCKFVIEYENYDETLTFYFKENKMIKYERHEVFYDDPEHPTKEIYETFKDKAKNYETTDSFKYTVKYKNKNVYIDTFLDAVKEEDIIKNYVGGLGIEYTYTPEQVISKLNSTNYECKLK